MRLLSAIIGAGIVAAAATASAATISIMDTDGDPTSVSDLAPGSTFQIRTILSVDPGEDILGVGFRLSASQSGLFTIVGRTMEAANPFSDLLTADPTLSAHRPTLSPSNGADLGGFVPDFSTRGEGSYSLYTLTIQLAPNAAKGSYQLNATSVQLSDGNFDTVLGNSTPYFVSVPEPMAVGTMVVASGGLLFRRRSARSAS